MKEKVITLPRGSLSSRKSAIIERHKVECIVKDGNIFLHYELTGVGSMPESYSNKLFGVLTLRYGIARVLKCIQLNNADEHILASVAKVFKRRNDERESINKG